MSNRMLRHESLPSYERRYRDGSIAFHHASHYTRSMHEAELAFIEYSVQHSYAIQFSSIFGSTCSEQFRSEYEMLGPMSVK